MNKLKVCVVGGGSWGTVLGKVLSEKGVRVFLLVRRKDLADNINFRHENPDYLPGIRLPQEISATINAYECLEGANLVIWTIPSHALRSFFESLSREEFELLKSIEHHLLGIKGIDLETGKFPSQILRERLGEKSNIYILGGPSFAKEVAKGLPTAVVVSAFGNLSTLKWVQETLAHRYFRVYRNDDPVGVECAGALKNVIAIAGGICDGLELGANARASLITRGLLELIRVGEVFGAKKETFYGLAGLGDLVLTCTSALSRNYRLGFLLAKGYSLESALKEIKEVAEGYRTAKVVKEISEKFNLTLPICSEVYNILYEKTSVTEALERLLSRELKEEFW
jgi:glycerol-3-phosphate dehydrogenase (NAD(P)+)